MLILNCETGTSVSHGVPRFSVSRFRDTPVGAVSYHHISHGSKTRCNKSSCYIIVQAFSGDTLLIVQNVLILSGTSRDPWSGAKNDITYLLASSLGFDILTLD